MEYGLYRNRKYYGQIYQNTALSLYQKYSYDDVCRLLEWEKSQVALKAGQLGVDLELFVRKNKDDQISKEFYYLGRIHPTGEANEIVMKKANKRAVEIHYRLETAVREDIYDYLCEDPDDE